MQIRTFGVKICHTDIVTASVLTKFHNSTDIFLRNINGNSMKLNQKKLLVKRMVTIATDAQDAKK